MIKYKSGDLWKVIVLVILIAATFSLSFRFILTSGLKPHGPARPPQAASQTDPKSAGPELFVQRAQPTSELLGRARAAADPFRPYVTAASQSSAVPAAPAVPRSGGTLPPLRDPSQTEFRLVGVISGTYPLAVIAAEGSRHFVRVGETLPSGWRVAKLDDDSVLLAKGQDRITLSLSEDGPRT
jgi:Tfp pilus assembly protein PilP